MGELDTSTPLRHISGQQCTTRFSVVLLPKLNYGLRLKGLHHSFNSGGGRRSRPGWSTLCQWGGASELRLGLGVQATAGIQEGSPLGVRGSIRPGIFLGNYLDLNHFPGIWRPKTAHWYFGIRRWNCALSHLTVSTYCTLFKAVKLREFIFCSIHQKIVQISFLHWRQNKGQNIYCPFE